MNLLSKDEIKEYKLSLANYQASHDAMSDEEYEKWQEGKSKIQLNDDSMYSPLTKDEGAMNESERISLASKVAMIMLKHTSCLGLKFDHVNASYEIVDKLLTKHEDNK